MSHVSRRLPAQPHIDIPKREARELLKQWKTGQTDAFERIRGRHPKFENADDTTIATATIRLSDAQLVIAREYNFSSWPELKRRIEMNPAALALEDAIRAGDADQTIRLLREHPQMLHLPVRSGNWGPPMSFAANLGRLDIVQAVARLGAHDKQHAFDRALLQGQIECARWLYEQGATLDPGIVMGACETLNAAGVRFLAESGAPFTDAQGDRLAPLAMVLETYSRYPNGKHEILELFATHGYAMADTPIMAFHRGRVDLLETLLDRDPGIVEKRFSYREIYPPELGCHDDGLSGLHGTPVTGTTLLHLAIDFDEMDIFELLLDRGADVNARATIDPNGYGGHTPLFNAVVSEAFLCGYQRDAAMAKKLLERGASQDLRANLRKFLDWTKKPDWHEANDVTAAEWGTTFPDANWVNVEALRILERS